MPRAASAGRCASNASSWPLGSGSSSAPWTSRSTPSSSRQTSSTPEGLQTRSACRGERAGLARVRCSAVGEIGPALARREDDRALELAQRALRERRERPDALDDVSEELDADRLAPRRPEDVENAAANGDLRRAPPRARRARSRRGRAPPRAPRARSPGRRRSRPAPPARPPGGKPSAAAAAEMQTRPPFSRTESARSRSPTRCGGGRRPESTATPRPGMNATGSAPRYHEAASAASRASSSSGRRQIRLRPSRRWSAARTSGSAGSETRARTEGSRRASSSSSPVSASTSASARSGGWSMTKDGIRIPRGSV